MLIWKSTLSVGGYDGLVADPNCTFSCVWRRVLWLPALAITRCDDWHGRMRKPYPASARGGQGSELASRDRRERNGWTRRSQGTASPAYAWQRAEMENGHTTGGRHHE